MIWFLLPAFAQNEVCSPQSLERWRGEVEAARTALEDLRLNDAIDLLDDAQNVARCVADVIPRADVQRFAQLRTLQAFYQQDALVLETWAQLVVSLGDVEWPIAADHPLRRLLTDIEATPVGRVEGKVLAPPKRGGVWIDGAWSDLPATVPGTYHLIQVFDGEHVLVTAYWQDGLGFRPELLGEGPPPPPPRGYEPGARGDGKEAKAPKAEWKLARKDSLKAYVRYVDNHPDGEHVPYARRRIDDIRWAQTPKTPEGASAYLASFPNGRNRGAAEGVLQGAEFKQVLDDGSTEALKLFLGKYPDGVYAAAARRQLDERAWVEALMEGSEQAYARYRVRWPQGAHLEEARIAQDDLAWQSADGKGRKAVEKYLQQWPTGGHAREAKAYLAGLSFRTVRVAVGGSAPEVARLQAAAVVREELQAMGFEVVEEAEDGTTPASEATVELSVDELDVGQGLGRWITTLVVRVERSTDPLAREELLQDPAALRDSLMDLEEKLRPEIRRLGKFRRKGD